MITSKIPNIGTSIFATMSQLAIQNNAINLSQGFPDFACSEELISLVNKYMRTGYNQYAPMGGVLELREAIAKKTFEAYGFEYDPDTQITITAGATQALNAAITAFVSENDEVIVFEPTYDSYVPVIKLNGGQPVYIELKQPDFSIDWNEVKKAINARTRMIILNSPHNPTGSVISDSDLKELAKLVAGSKIIVLSDEVYEHIVFDKKKHNSICSYPQLAERSLLISSFGKTFHTTGWKIGYCMAPDELMKEFRKIHQFQVFAVNTPIQYAIAEFLQKKENYSTLSNLYQEKRDFFLNLMKSSRFKFKKTEGTYFQLADYSNISDDYDISFAEHLTIEHKVATIPVSVFYHDKIKLKLLRFCFAKENNTLERAAEILVKL